MQTKPLGNWLKLGILSLLLAPAVLLADETLEKALSGFDEPNSDNRANPSDLQQALEGFEEIEKGTLKALKTTRPVDFSSEIAQKTASEQSDKYAWRLGGDIGFAAAYAYHAKAPKVAAADWRGWNQAKLYSRMQLEKDGQNWQVKISANGFYESAYDLKGREQYETSLLSRQQAELELGESYLSARLNPDWDIKIGRQIEVWGTSDTIRVTDVLNPLDNRQPGLTDIEDLRLPITMSKLSYYWQDWQFSFLALHEQRPGKEAAVGSDFMPSDFLPNSDLPNVSREADWQTTPALAVEGRFSGWDLSLYAAQVLDSRWHLDRAQNERRYSTVKMTGLAANWAIKGWLLKTEWAYLSELRYNTTDQLKNRLDGLFGLEYLSLHHWSFSLEVADRWIQDYESQMANFPDVVDAHNFQTAFRAGHDLYHDLGRVNYLLSAFGERWQQGGFQRLWVEYDWTDHQQVTLGVIDYFGGDHPYWRAIENNDRLFADWVWRF